MIASSPPQAGAQATEWSCPSDSEPSSSSRANGGKKDFAAERVSGQVAVEVCGVSVIPGSPQSYLERGADNEVIRVFPLRVPQCDAAKVVELVEPELGIERHP